MDAPWLRVLPGALEVRIRVVPRSSRDRIAGVVGDRLKIQVTSPPVEGEANAAVREMLARAVRVPLRAVTLAHGATGRSKTVRIDCDDAKDVAARLRSLAAEPR